jgi:STE24 endopeptidase
MRARSNGYVEGGYWLLLWDFLSTVVAMWILLKFRWSMHVRDWAERVTRFRSLKTALYWVQFGIVLFVLTFPLTVYESYFREHKYGLLNRPFGPWMRDQAVMLAVTVVLGAILLVPLLGLLRRLGKNWWVWGAVLDLMLGEYRKLDPGLEEFIFFDHPSGRTRITAAMRWKAEYPESASPEELARPLFNTTP